MEVSTGSALKYSMFCPECIHVCLMDQTTSNTHFWTHNRSVFITDRLCLLRSTNWIF